MGGNRKLAKNLKTCIAVVLVLLMCAGAVFCQQRTTFDNPLDEMANSMLMLSAEGKALIEEQEIQKPPEDVEEPEPEEEEKPPEEEQEPEKSDETKPTEDEAGDEPGNSGDTGTEPGPGVTNVIYFTTSIIDGETITSKAYTFSLHHKIPELVPQSTQVYVNGTLAENIQDARTEFNLLLSEGENTVRVQVSYENQNGQVLSPYKDYTIYVDTRNLVINTSLQDGMTVDTAYLAFAASAEFGQDAVDLLVSLDGEELSQFDGIYECQLQEGENHITLEAEYRGNQAAETYTIYYEPPEGLYIDTDLEDQMVIRAETGDFFFRAEALGGGLRTEFKVTLNGKKIEGENGRYHVTLLPATELDGGNNIIRLIARDDEQEESLRFRVKYIPIATPETEPKIVHTNISDGTTISKKNPYTLEIAAEDYKGRKIYFDGVEVFLNGKKQILRDTKPYITYKLNFEDGENTVIIKVTDDDGRYKEFSYVINYEQPDENEKIGTVRVIVDANVLGKGTLIETDVDLMAADSASHVIVRALEKQGFGYQIEGTLDQDFYLAHIEKSGIGMRYDIPEALRQEINDYGIPWSGEEGEKNPERAMDSLGQRDYTAGSGWLILIDGEFITEGASAVDVSDGAIIKVRFTLAWGMDIGGYYLGDTFENTY